MPDKTDVVVRKLLRVLVAGGIALAGVGGARADDKTATPAEKPDTAKQSGDEQKAGSTTAEQGEKSDKVEKEQKQTRQQDQKKSDKDKKAAESEGDGVKGW